MLVLVLGSFVGAGRVCGVRVVCVGCFRVVRVGVDGGDGAGAGVGVCVGVGVCAGI